MVPRLGIGKARNGGEGTRKAHLLQHIVGCDVVIDVAELNLRQRFFEQSHLLQHFLVFLVCPLAEQFNSVGIVHHLTVQRYRAHAVALKFQCYQFARFNLQRCKQADVGIGKHFHLVGGNVNLPEVRNTCVVRTANQVAVVEREAELSQVAVLPSDQLLGFELGVCQFLSTQQLQGVLTVIALGGHREQLAVVADVDVKHAHAKREGIDDFRFLKIFVIADDGLCAPVGEQTVQTVACVVVNDIADALVLQFLDHLFLLQVIDGQTAHLGIIPSEDKPVAITVECHEGRVVELYAVDGGHFPLLTGV